LSLLHIHTHEFQMTCRKTDIIF